MAQFTLTPEALEMITEVASQTATTEAINAYRKEMIRNSPRKRRNTKARKILEHYSDLKLLVLQNNVRPTQAEIDELNFGYMVAMMEDREDKMERIMEEELSSRVRTFVQLKEIDDALKLLRTSCENSQNPERLRQYRSLESRYLIDKKLTVEEIAEKEAVSTSTVTRDISMAVNMFAFFLRPDLEFFD